MAGVQKVRLNNLNINLKNALIVGIIIAKNSPRTIGSKKKNGDSRGVTSFSLRDSQVDTINVDVWGSEYFVLTFYERFLVGDVVEVTSPKICVKSGENENFRPQVTSPFYLSLNEGASDVTIHTGDMFHMYLPLLHIPTKPSAGYCGLAEVLKLTENTQNIYVDLLVVVKSVKPAKTIKTRTGQDMTVRSVEIVDNTTPAPLDLDMFDIDTIQRAEDWRPMESVLFIADAKVSWRRGVKVQVCAKSVITHQPHTADAESLRLYIKNQSTQEGGSGGAWGAWGAWAAWSGSRAASASVAQLRDRLTDGTPFCACLHALLTHIDLEAIFNTNDNNDELRVRFSDHTGELSARLPINVLVEVLGCNVNSLRSMTADERNAIRWKILLEQCNAKIAVASCKITILALRRASPADPIPLY